MQNFIFLKTFIALLLVTFLLITGCAKYTGDYTATNIQQPFNGNTYDYLKSKPGIFDSMLVVIDRLGLADTLKNKKTTLFAVTNQSFILALNNYNASRIQQGKSPVNLRNYDQTVMESMLCRYIIMNEYKSDSMAYENGFTFSTVRYGYPMNGKKIITGAGGYAKGGISAVTFSDTKQTLFSGLWAQALTTSIDIQTANGVVFIMAPEHVFGFDEFIKPRPTPFTGTPFQFPIAIGGTGVILEAENFDLGGETAGYHDTDPLNKSGNYRLGEGVDIGAHSASSVNGISYTAGYDIGNVAVGEWLLFTVNVPADGNYKIQSRYGIPGGYNNNNYHIEIDNVNVTGKVYVTSTGGWTTWGISTTNLQLTAGKHTMKFFWNTGNIQLDSFVIIRNN